MAKKPSAEKGRRRNPGVPVEETNLTAGERALLPDSSIVTEDDADFIVGHRRRHEKPIPLNKVLKRYGMERRRPVER